MDTNGMFLLLDYLMLAYGVFALYGAWKVHGSGEVPKSLWNKDLPLSKCRDKAGFAKFMTPRLAVTGVLVVINGVVGIIADKNSDLSVIFNLIPVLIIIVVLVWYIVFTRKAEKLFF